MHSQGDPNVMIWTGGAVPPSIFVMSPNTNNSKSAPDRRDRSRAPANRWDSALRVFGKHTVLRRWKREAKDKLTPASDSNLEDNPSLFPFEHATFAIRISTHLVR